MILARLRACLQTPCRCRSGCRGGWWAALVEWLVGWWPVAGVLGLVGVAAGVLTVRSAGCVVRWRAGLLLVLRVVGSGGWWRWVYVRNVGG